MSKSEFYPSDSYLLFFRHALFIDFEFIQLASYLNLFGLDSFTVTQVILINFQIVKHGIKIEYYFLSILALLYAFLEFINMSQVFSPHQIPVYKSIEIFSISKNAYTYEKCSLNSITNSLVVVVPGSNKFQHSSVINSLCFNL